VDSEMRLDLDAIVARAEAAINNWEQNTENLALKLEKSFPWETYKKDGRISYRIFYTLAALSRDFWEHQTQPEDIPRLAAEVTRLQEYSEEVRKGINAALREYARANTRLAAAREKAEKLKEAAKGRDFTLELETAITDLAAAIEEK